MYVPLTMRNTIYPVSAIGSTLAFPLFIGGLILSWQPLMLIGIALFTFAVFFSVITLPVEFNASSRAMKALADGGYLVGDELSGARSVLTAAALTYVAAAAMAIMQLVRLLILADRD
jgi:Zn-dependent membrane protease YugP